MTQLEKGIERAQIGLAELNADGLFLSVNSAYLMMLGVDERDLLGKHWRNTVHPGDYAQVDEAYEMARTNGRGYAEVKGTAQRFRNRLPCDYDNGCHGH